MTNEAQKQWYDLCAYNQIQSDPVRRVLECAMIGIDLDLFNQFKANSDLTQEQWKMVATQLANQLISCADMAEDIEKANNKLHTEKIYDLAASIRNEVFGLCG